MCESNILFYRVRSEQRIEWCCQNARWPLFGPQPKFDKSEFGFINNNKCFNNVQDYIKEYSSTPYLRIE